MTTRRDPTREPLADLIPLDSPWCGFIEPTNRCNFRCAFCPTGSPELLQRAGRRLGSMSLDFAKQLIDQYALFPRKSKILNFQYMGEPLLNPFTPDMIAYAVEKDVSEWYEIRTNGALLNPKLNQRLVDAGLNRIGISVEAMGAEGYFRISGVKNFDFERFVDNIADLHSRMTDTCEVYIKLPDYGLSEAEKVKFFELFEPLSDDIQLEYLIDWNRSSGHDFKLGNVTGRNMKGDFYHIKNVCPYPFYTLGVTWNGECVMCCVDWSYGTSVGNAHEQTLQEIWKGERHRDFMRMHLEGRRKEHPCCGTCTGLYMCPNSIDDKAKEIAGRLAQKG